MLPKYHVTREHRTVDTWCQRRTHPRCAITTRHFRSLPSWQVDGATGVYSYNSDQHHNCTPLSLYSTSLPI